MPPLETTPPTRHALRKYKREPSSSAFENKTWRAKCYHALQAVQAHLQSNLLSSASPQSQSATFRSCAPLFIFFHLFSLGVIAPRHPATKALVANSDGDPTSGLALAVAAFLTSVFLMLAVLRFVIWLLAKTAQWFCQLDLSKLGHAKTRDSDFELSEANILLGWILD